MRLSIAFTIDSVTFTAGVIAGDVSLGGSESACLGLARGLAARGHDVHIFTTKIGADAPNVDHAGVHWHDLSKLAAWNIYQEWDVAIALRQPSFLQSIPAKFRMLWNQDLMANEAMKNYAMSIGWAYDAVAYVSEFHRAQWEGWLPELKPLGWVTKNGHDAELAANARKTAIKNPNQIIHISRPERGLVPILEMWPALRQAHPEATLKLCRYSSMYDPDGWGAICKDFDAEVAKLQATVGGIDYLGELGKPALYQAIAESAVMWYPGISTFAETSCIAAVEAQACGTPFVGSWKGALPETAPAATLIEGVAETDPAYHAASVAAVIEALNGCARSSFDYRRQVKAGLAHVEGYRYDVIAAEWEAFLLASFTARYQTEKLGILHRLDREDDLTTANLVAAEILSDVGASTYARIEAVRITALAERVACGLEHTAENYAHFALPPAMEIDGNGPRHGAIVKAFTGCQRILDVACGNGAIAILLALADPTRTVVAADFSEANITAAKAEAEARGVADRVTFVCTAVWDMAAQQPSPWLSALEQEFDGVVCGEFMEHVTDCTGLVDAVERVVKSQGRCVWTVPMGPLNTLVTRQEALYRSHVHHFRPTDLDAMFGAKEAYVRQAMPWGVTAGRGDMVGNWIVSYRKVGATGVRPVDRRILLRPYHRITAGIITNDATDLRRCLDGVWPVVDEIILGDCGAPAGSLEAVAAEFPRKTRIIPVGVVAALEGGFSEARNTVLAAAQGAWFFWIDSDEVLAGQTDLGKYLDGPLFNGYVITQNHLHLDRAMGTDTPVRVFRKRPDIQFYGVVHEQPQMGDCNGDISPLLQVADVQIAHTGYLHEAIRRNKAITRNLPLLIRDQQKFPDRLLGKLLILRDHANLAHWEMERSRGVVTPIAQHHYGQVVAYFEDYFADPTHKYYPLARPFYEQALKRVDGAMEIEVAITGGAAPDGINGARVKPQRMWVRNTDHLRSALHQQIDTMIASIQPAAPLMVDPIVPKREAVTA